MSAFHHYELLCDHRGCDATCNVGETRADVTRRRAAQLGWTTHPVRIDRYARLIDLCPEHSAAVGADIVMPVPEAGEPLPSVCVHEVWLPVEVMREIRDCIVERVRWFESRGRPVPQATRDAAAVVGDAIDWANGDPEKHERRLPAEARGIATPPEGSQ